MSNVIYHDFTATDNFQQFIIDTVANVKWELPINIYKEFSEFDSETPHEARFECENFAIGSTGIREPTNILLIEVSIWYKEPKDLLFAMNFVSYILMLADSRSKLCKYSDFVHALTDVYFKIDKELHGSYNNEYEVCGQTGSTGLVNFFQSAPKKGTYLYIKTK